MPDLLLYINSLSWRFVHFSSGHGEQVRRNGEARDGRDDRPHCGKKRAD